MNFHRSRDRAPTIDHRSKQLDPVIKDVKQINRKRLMSEREKTPNKRKSIYDELWTVHRVRWASLTKKRTARDAVDSI